MARDGSMLAIGISRSALQKYVSRSAASLATCISATHSSASPLGMLFTAFHLDPAEGLCKGRNMRQNVSRCPPLSFSSQQKGRVLAEYPQSKYSTKYTHLLHIMGVHVEDVLVLEADEVEGGGGTAPNDACALGPCQHLLQLRAVPRIDLRPGTKIQPALHEGI